MDQLPRSFLAQNGPPQVDEEHEQFILAILIHEYSSVSPHGFMAGLR
jgi:hypothetical protein